MCIALRGLPLSSAFRATGHIYDFSAREISPLACSGAVAIYLLSSIAACHTFGAPGIRSDNQAHRRFADGIRAGNAFIIIDIE